MTAFSDFGRALVERTKSAIRPTLLKLRGAFVARVMVIASGAHAPGFARNLLHRSGAGGDAQWYGALLPTGHVLLNAKHLQARGMAAQTLRHEVFGHLGLRARLKAGMSRAMDLLRRANPRLRAEAAVWMQDFGGATMAFYRSAGIPEREAEKRVKALSIEEALCDRAGRRAALTRPKKIREGLRQRSMRAVGRWWAADKAERRREAETALLLLEARAEVSRLPRWLSRLLPAKKPGRPTLRERWDAAVRWRPAKWRARGMSHG